MSRRANQGGPSTFQGSQNTNQGTNPNILGNLGTQSTPYKKENYCKKPGHYKRECRKWLSNQRAGKVRKGGPNDGPSFSGRQNPNNPSEHKAYIVEVTCFSTMSFSNIWYLDSAAPEHITPIQTMVHWLWTSLSKSNNYHEIMEYLRYNSTMEMWLTYPNVLQCGNSPSTKIRGFHEFQKLQNHGWNSSHNESQGVTKW